VRQVAIQTVQCQELVPVLRAPVAVEVAAEVEVAVRRLQVGRRVPGSPVARSQRVEAELALTVVERQLPERD